MKFRNTLLAFSALTLLPAAADAGVIIDSINVKMVGMRYDVRGSSDPAATFAAARTAFDDSFDSAGSPCSRDLSAMTDVSYRGTCGSGSQSDYGSLYTISGSVMGPALFEFGLDWGRGGFIAETSGPGIPLVYLNDDIWWGKNWDHKDVKGGGSQAAASILLPQEGSFTLTLLGFEGCCDGVNSGRYQSLAYQDLGNQLLPFTGDESGRSAPPAGSQSGNRANAPFNSFAAFPGGAGSLTAPPSDDAWNELAINAVPLPGSLPLMGLGAGLLAFGRRRPGRAERA